jgi:phage-related protein
MKDFISEIISRVREERKLLVDTVTAGTNVNSFDDYQKLIGQIEGLNTAIRVIDDILTENDEENS